MKCKCGYDNPDDALYCNLCMAVLRRESQAMNGQPETLGTPESYSLSSLDLYSGFSTSSLNKIGLLFMSLLFIFGIYMLITTKSIFGIIYLIIVACFIVDLKFSYETEHFDTSGQGVVVYKVFSPFFGSGTDSYQGLNKVESIIVNYLSRNQSKYVVFEDEHRILIPDGKNNIVLIQEWFKKYYGKDLDVYEEGRFFMGKTLRK